MKKLVQKTSDKLLSEEVGKITADEIVDLIATTIPGIDIAYKLAKAYLGRGMRLRQQRVLEWVEYVRDNIGLFSKQLFDNEQFQDCFVILLENYVKERAREKRLIYKKVLLGITELTPNELEKYQLERILTITNQISFEGLNVLFFIKSELLIQIEKDIKKQLKAYKDQEGVEKIRLEDITRKRIIVSDYISKWIYEKFNINSEKKKKKYNLNNSSTINQKNEIAYKEHLKSIELMEPLDELSNLGLLIKKNGTATFGGSVGSGFSITNFGYEYIKYIEDTDI